MNAVNLDSKFWEAVDIIITESLEWRKNQFLFVVEGYKADEFSLDVVLMMSCIFGGEEGSTWLREAIPFDDRLKEYEKINQANISEDAKNRFRCALMGAETFLKTPELSPLSSFQLNIGHRMKTGIGPAGLLAH